MDPRLINTIQDHIGDMIHDLGATPSEILMAMSQMYEECGDGDSAAACQTASENVDDTPLVEHCSDDEEEDE